MPNVEWKEFSAHEISVKNSSSMGQTGMKRKTSPPTQGNAERIEVAGESAPEPVILIIADISGYTRYMTANAKTLAHSQTIITELILAIIKQVELPIAVAKLEGDAVFLYCRKQNSSQSWPETRKIIGEKLFSFFEMFRRKVAELSRSTTCHCSACSHIEKLRLKLIVHSGEALFHQVLQFLELAGVDVIIVHRLLKNSVSSDQYLLLTETARRDIDLPDQIHLLEGLETYDDLGSIKTLVYLPRDIPIRLQDLTFAKSANVSLVGKKSPGFSPVLSPPPPFIKRFGQSWKLFCKLFLSPLVGRSASQPPWRHITSSASVVGKIGFAMVTLLLAPIYLPVGTVSVLLHVLKKPKVNGGQEEKSSLLN
ncbi:MAG: DUF2652 domain-containing protein [Verrucomicrobiota bacterium]